MTFGLKRAKIAIPSGKTSSLFKILSTGWPSSLSVSRILLSVIAGIMYVSIPWETMSGTIKFADIDNYSATAAILVNGSHLELDGFVEILFSEPGWGLIMASIAIFLEDPSVGFFIISWFCASAYYSFISKRAGHALAICVLLNPLVIDLVLSQIRSSFALALCLIAISSNKKIPKAALTVYALTVHSAVFVLLATYIYSAWTQSTRFLDSQWKRGIASLAFALIVSILLSHGRELLLTSVGDRRAEYDVDASSILYTAFWMIWAVLMPAIAAQRNEREWLWIHGLTAILFATAFFMAIFSTNGTRFIALALPFLASVLGTLPPNTRAIGLFSLLAYQCVQFLYWY